MEEYYFAPSDIARMAMKLENAGAAFYQGLSHLVESPELEKFFLALSKAELKHRQRFQDIAEANRAQPPGSYTIDIRRTMENLVDKIKEDSFNLTVIGKVPDTAAAGLKMAIHVEKEAIRIYGEIRENFITQFHDVLNEIIAEEKKHLTLLSDIEAKLNA